MAILVNGERIPDALVTAECELLRKSQMAGAAPAEDQLRLMAACAVVDKVLIRVVKSRFEDWWRRRESIS
jgi:hypothetical protein